MLVNYFFTFASAFILGYLTREHRTIFKLTIQHHLCMFNLLPKNPTPPPSPSSEMEMEMVELDNNWFW
jgi:hypothetical protein